MNLNSRIFLSASGTGKSLKFSIYEAFFTWLWEAYGQREREEEERKGWRLGGEIRVQILTDKGTSLFMYLVSIYFLAWLGEVSTVFLTLTVYYSPLSTSLTSKKWSGLFHPEERSQVKWREGW